MDAGAPDPDMVPPPLPPASLAARLGGALRARGEGQGSRWTPYALAALIAAGPLLTIAGAGVLASRERAATARLEAELAPRIAARAAAQEARAALAPVLAAAPAASVIDLLARALPGDASLLRVERLANGTLELDIAAPDPDALRAALRRSPDFARVRPLGQRQGEGMIVATFLLEGV
jgi:hypothetical protein